jgi:hypothetical protein
MSNKLNIQIPNNLDEQEQELWDIFVETMNLASDNNLIELEYLDKMILDFSKLSKEAKADSLFSLNKHIADTLEQINSVIFSMNKEIKTDLIEKKIQEAPEDEKPLYEYVLYTVANGGLLDENILNQYKTYLSLTPQQKQELHELELAKKFSEMKSGSNKFRASDLTTNQVFDADDVAKLIEQSQPQTVKIQQKINNNLNNPQNSQSANNIIANKQNLQPSTIPSQVKTRPKPKQIQPSHINNIQRNNPVLSPQNPVSFRQNQLNNPNLRQNQNNFLEQNQPPQQIVQNNPQNLNLAPNPTQNNFINQNLSRPTNPNPPVLNNPQNFNNNNIPHSFPGGANYPTTFSNSNFVTSTNPVRIMDPKQNKRQILKQRNNNISNPVININNKVNSNNIDYTKSTLQQISPNSRKNVGLEGLLGGG